MRIFPYVLLVLAFLRINQLEHFLTSAEAIRDGWRDQVTDAREYIAHLTRRPPGVRK